MQRKKEIKLNVRLPYKEIQVNPSEKCAERRKCIIEIAYEGMKLFIRRKETHISLFYIGKTRFLEGMNIALYSCEYFAWIIIIRVIYIKS